MLWHGFEQMLVVAAAAASAQFLQTIAWSWSLSCRLECPKTSIKALLGRIDHASIFDTVCVMQEASSGDSELLRQ